MKKQAFSAHPSVHATGAPRKSLLLILSSQFIFHPELLFFNKRKILCLFIARKPNFNYWIEVRVQYIAL